MDEFQRRARRAVRITLWMTALWVFLWGAGPAGKPVFAGLAAGSAVSLYYVVSVRRQTEQAARVAVSGERRRPGFGLVARFAAVLLLAMVVSKWPSVNRYAALAGVLTGPLAVALDALLTGWKGSRSLGKE
jgi:hypothetical protein